MNKSASDLAKLRWSRLTPEQRSKVVPRNGGRPRIYPPCNKKYHRWNGATCRHCGYVRPKIPDA